VHSNRWPTIVTSVTAAIALGLSGPAVSARNGTAKSASGLFGIVSRGPTKPVCEVNASCTAPAKVTLIFSRRGHEVARTHTGLSGAYRISLAAGSYAVSTTLPVFGRVPDPATVRVAKSRFREVDFMLDTGIR
jgi:hypothetical protein